MQSGEFLADMRKGAGVYIWGLKPYRSELFAYMARVVVMNELGAYFTTLHNAVYALDNDAEKRSLLMRVKVLFLNDIQKTYPPSVKNTDSPYNLNDLEFLLAARKQNGLVTHFSAGVAWDRLSWLSQEALTDLADITTKIAL